MSRLTVANQPLVMFDSDTINFEREFISSTGAIPIRRGVFGDNDLPTLLNSVSCNGNETELLKCVYNDNRLSATCGTLNDAAVVCQSK